MTRTEQRKLDRAKKFRRFTHTCHPVVNATMVMKTPVYTTADLQVGEYFTVMDYIGKTTDFSYRGEVLEVIEVKGGIISYRILNYHPYSGRYKYTFSRPSKLNKNNWILRRVGRAWLIAAGLEASKFQIGSSPRRANTRCSINVGDTVELSHKTYKQVVKVLAIDLPYILGEREIISSFLLTGAHDLRECKVKKLF